MFHHKTLVVIFYLQHKQSINFSPTHSTQRVASLAEKLIAFLASQSIYQQTCIPSRRPQMLPITIVLIFLSCYEIDRFYEKVFLTAQTEIKKHDEFADYDVKFEIFDGFFNKTNNYPSMRKFNEKYYYVRKHIMTYPYQFVKFGYCNETNELVYGTNKTEQIVGLGRRQLNGEAVILNRRDVILSGVETNVQKLFDVVKAMLRSNVSMCEGTQ